MSGPVIAAIAGFLIAAAILWEAFETIVLPRRATRRFRFTRLFYRSTWIPWRALARRMRRPKRRETFLSVFGPLSLLFLFVLWAAGIILAFGLLYYSVARFEGAAGAAHSGPHDFVTCLYLSGTTFFTLGLGDVTPFRWGERWLTVIESGLGFGFLALVFSYLPVIYQAFSRREVNIVLLDSRAGSPPTAAELIRRHAGLTGWNELHQLLRDWERVAAEILESHVSYPVVAYFRSQHNNESWLAALTAILDASALLIAGMTGFQRTELAQGREEARRGETRRVVPEGTAPGGLSAHAASKPGLLTPEVKTKEGPGEEIVCARQARLTFAMCRHTAVDLAQVFSAAPHARHERLPLRELNRLRAALAQSGFALGDTPESNEKLRKLREMYEPYVESLGRYLLMDVPPWILTGDVIENWRTSAWGRISGFSTQGTPVGDDHSD
jgi:Ion channel